MENNGCFLPVFLCAGSAYLYLYLPFIKLSDRTFRCCDGSQHDTNLEKLAYDISDCQSHLTPKRDVVMTLIADG